ncbi:hypothetical protein H2203_009157 [Taxawa tesnikishii (nom. ined.)]|nr:hypothetical protein H2203_009157 [Dothideales sp. JES 119]
MSYTTNIPLSTPSVAAVGPTDTIATAAGRNNSNHNNNSGITTTYGLPRPNNVTPLKGKSKALSFFCATLIILFFIGWVMPIFLIPFYLWFPGIDAAVNQSRVLQELGVVALAILFSWGGSGFFGFATRKYEQTDDLVMAGKVISIIGLFFWWTLLEWGFRNVLSAC